MPNEVIDKVKVRLSNGKFKQDPVPLGTSADNVMCYEGKQPLSEVLENITSKFEVLEKYLTKTKGLDGLDGRSIFICYKRVEENSPIVYSYEELMDVDKNYPTTYLMGIFIGYNKPSKESEYQFIRMGGEQGIQGIPGEKGEKGDRGEIGKPFTVKGTIDCTKGLILENIVISSEDVGTAYYVYEIDEDTQREVTNLYLIGYPVEYINDEEGHKVIKPIEEGQKPEWLKIDSMKGESAYEIAKTTWNDDRTIDETSYEESLTAYGLWYWSRTESEREEVLGEEKADRPWYDVTNKKLWLEWNRGDSNYDRYLAEHPDSIYTTEEMYLNSLKGDIITGFEITIDEQNKNQINYVLRYKTYSSGEEKEAEPIEGSTVLSSDSLFYLENAPSIGINPTYSLIQRVGLEENGVNNNEIIGFNSVAFGKSNQIKSSKENASIDDSKKIIANATIGEGNVITDAQGCTAAGVGLLVSGAGQVAVGQYNTADSDAQFIVGIGTGLEKENRKNGLIVKKPSKTYPDGQVKISGELEIGGQVTAAARLVAPEIATDKIVSDSLSISGKIDSKGLDINGYIKATNFTIEDTIKAKNIEIDGGYLKVAKLEVTDDKTDLFYSGSITCDTFKKTDGSQYTTMDGGYDTVDYYKSSQKKIDSPSYSAIAVCHILYKYIGDILIISITASNNGFGGDSITNPAFVTDYWYKFNLTKYLIHNNVSYTVDSVQCSPTGSYGMIRQIYSNLYGHKGEAELFPVIYKEKDDIYLYVGCDEASSVAQGYYFTIIAHR